MHANPPACVVAFVCLFVAQSMMSPWVPRVGAAGAGGGGRRYSTLSLPSPSVFADMIFDDDDGGDDDDDDDNDQNTAGRCRLSISSSINRKHKATTPRGLKNPPPGAGGRGGAALRAPALAPPLPCTAANANGSDATALELSPLVLRVVDRNQLDGYVRDFFIHVQ